LFTVLCLSASSVAGQETSQVQELKQQLQQLQESFRKMQDEQQQKLEALQRQIELLQQQHEARPAPAAPAVEPAPAAVPAPMPSAPAPESPPGPVGAAPFSPSAPITLFGGERNYLNLSLDGLFAVGTSTAGDIDRLQLGGHDPQQRGFTFQNLEAVFDGKVDPYFRAQANIVLQIDREGETVVEAEEAYLETMSLPGNLQVKAGQFFTEFGRLNPTHPHSWDFVDQPLVNGRFLGPDGLRSAGARVSWLVPTPFYSELFFTIANSQGGTAYSFRNDHDDDPFFGRPSEDRQVKTLGDMLFVPRYAMSFDLTDSQTLLAGASAAFGPNSSGSDTDTQVYGVDLFWKWKSPHQHAGFPFVTWQTEAMMRRFDAGSYPGDANTPPLKSETIVDYGLYSQVAYGFRKGWVTALRGDYLFPEEQAAYERFLGSDPDRATRWRLSPDLTWYPSEFSKLRLQYNFDHRHGIGDDHSVWLQAEFLLGSHAAHKF
jgi:hypothetical protein